MNRKGILGLIAVSIVGLSFACAESSSEVDPVPTTSTSSGGGSSSGGSSSGSSIKSCAPTCNSDSDCASSCPAPPSGATVCCDLVTRKCYDAKGICPVPDAGQSSSGDAASMY